MIGSVEGVAIRGCPMRVELSAGPVDSSCCNALGDSDDWAKRTYSSGDMLAFTIVTRDSNKV